MTQNDDFRYLMNALPADITRRKEAGDLRGALRLIEEELGRNPLPEEAARLRAEKIRLERLPDDYPFTKEEAIQLVKKEWPDFTADDFDRLTDNRRIDWRYIDGEPRYFERFLECIRMYPAEAPGLRRETADTTKRDAMLARMEQKGEITGSVTIQAELTARVPTAGKRVRAWLPFPIECPEQSGFTVLTATPGYSLAEGKAHQRCIYWDTEGESSFHVAYSCCYHAVYKDPLTIRCDDLQPSFCTGEEYPHIVFTPFLRALTARVTVGARTAVEKAYAIYSYITENIDYRYQPDYIQLDAIADSCAHSRRGDCGVMALLFITMCRIAGIPAMWESGLSTRPGDAGPHDWAKFYIAPYGWLWADPSFGSGARRAGEKERQRHYFGSLDPWRMVANSRFQAPLTPPDPYYRHDPFDNQTGEMCVGERGLAPREFERKVTVTEGKLL